jgi:hypothetical protein
MLRECEVEHWCMPVPRTGGQRRRFGHGQNWQEHRRSFFHQSLHTHDSCGARRFLKTQTDARTWTWTWTWTDRQARMLGGARLPPHALTLHIHTGPTGRLAARRQALGAIEPARSRARRRRRRRRSVRMCCSQYNISQDMSCPSFILASFKVDTSVASGKPLVGGFIHYKRHRFFVRSRLGY